MRSVSTRSWMLSFVAGATLALGVSAAVSAPGGAPIRANDEKGSATTAVRATSSQAPGARLAALISTEVKAVRQKGVKSVKRIDKGVYCIRPKSSTGIKPSSSIVLLSTEYFYSSLTATKVEWASKGSGCAKNSIGVYTYDDSNSDTLFSPSNEVAFSILVP